MTGGVGRRLTLAAVVIVALGAAMAACSPRTVEPGPLAETPEAPAVLDGHFRTADGYTLPLRVWRPEDGAPRAVVVAVHGFNDYSKGFRFAGAYLAERGIALYAFDQRGFGRSPGFGLWPGQEAMTDDIAGLVQALKDRHPGAPVHLLGVSMGGAAVITTMTERNPAPPVDGVILAAPAVWARETMPWYQTAALFLASHTVPWLTLSGKDLGYQASDNIDVLRDMGRDPLFIKETRVDSMKGLVDLMDTALSRVDEVPGPVLYLYGEKDEIVPPEATNAALATLPEPAWGERVRVALYDEGWHLLLRDLQRDTVLADIVAWIEDQGAPLPSGEEAAPGTRVTAGGR